MNAEEARGKLATIGVGYSEDNFIKYVRSGDREVVELFLDAGIPPDIRDKDHNPAVLIANKAGKLDIVRLLLSRGASPDPLLGTPPQGKDLWDKLTAASGLLSFFSGILIALVGGYFTYSYNKRQIDLNQTQADHDAATKEQSNKVLELEAIQKLIPTLTSSDEKGKAAALVAIQDLAHPDLAAHLAVLFKGQGAVQYLEQAASSANPRTKQVAVQALSTLAARGKQADSQLAERALGSVFESTQSSVVLIRASRRTGEQVTGSGIIIGNSGFILTCTPILQEATANVEVETKDGRKLQAQIVNFDQSQQLAILKVNDEGFTSLRLAASPPVLGSAVIGIGYLSGMPQETAFVGTVVSIDDRYIYFNAATGLGAAGGPFLGNSGEVVGLLLGTKVPSSGKDTYLAFAIRSDVALRYIESHGIRDVLRPATPELSISVQ